MVDELVGRRVVAGHANKGMKGSFVVHMKENGRA